MHFLVYLVSLITLIHSGSATTQRRRVARDAGGNWSYDHPEEWGGSCNIRRNRQSPVDIEIDETAPLESLPLILGGAYNWNVHLSRDENGVISKVEAEPAILDGGSLKGTYAFLSLHFHFGSEHTVDGKRMDAEAHFVHYNLKYSPEDAMNQPDGLAVVGILLETGNDVDPKSNLLHKLIIGAPVEKAVLRDAFPQDLEPWIRYEGSLTTPPCTENVLWTVILNPVTVASLPKVSTPTFRPVQSISNRTIFIRHRDIRGENNTSGTMLSNAATTPLLLVIIAHLINQCQRTFL